MSEDEREALVARLLPVVHRIARRVARICRLRETDDLVGDGCVGLVRAIDTFDPARGVELDRYARHVILGAMLNGLRRNDPVSERARRRVREAERFRAEREARGEPLSDRELAKLIPGFERARAQVARGLPLSLDAPLPPGHALRVDWDGDPAHLYDVRRRSNAVHRALAALPKRQRQIVHDHYFEDLTLRALSARMAVTPQRVSQLHCAALARLYHALEREAG